MVVSSGELRVLRHVREESVSVWLRIQDGR